MRTWQDIFAEKIADVHLKEPWMLQEDDTLQVHVLEPGWKEFVQRRALGRFRCSQCFQEWSSAKVHILFHMCRGLGQGTVRMRTFRQACRRCPDPRLEEAEFNQETVERLLHNLVLKILQYFYHLPVQPSDLLEVVVDAPVAGPHNSTRCEGCQLGICSKSRPAPASDAWKPLMAKAHHTPKHQGRRPHVTPTHHPSPSNCNFPWKCCCCIIILLLCVLAVLLFILLYFTKK
ncbi:receptor-transporting protein 3-like [Rissa tridactyla]|uniref:receptor-transporting protein 3-like n=1 Tax=Rissa tridactyla TaxID=75485 RepID=UPI0023BAF6F5|nr:receptor-transporting protein 3-like [Rissa tridactyla]